MKYEQETREELVELLEGRDDEIEELKQNAGELEESAADYQIELEESIENSMDRQEQETLAEKSFYAGLESSRNLTQTPLKAWLNFKMENRL